MTRILVSEIDACFDVFLVMNGSVRNIGAAEIILLS